MEALTDHLDNVFVEHIESRFGFENKEPVVIETSNPINLSHLDLDEDSVLINLKTINNIKETNTFFREVNRILPDQCEYISFVESYPQRRERIRKKYHKLFVPFYLFIDFIFKRVFPKLTPSRRIYHFISADRNRAISLTESLGRLVYCGFEIEDVFEINNLHCIIARNTGDPLDEPEPSTGIILKMPRKGQNGEKIVVYKMRTMHPYAQYIQDFMYERNNLRKGGKIKNDFRISHWGKVLRKLMIDEFPMLINVLKGEIKLFGIRPLSYHYLSLYPEDLRERRLEYKPGFLPPYHADDPKTFEEIIESERKYLDTYDKAPLKTDIKYLFKALYNIFFKGVGSSKE